MHGVTNTDVILTPSLSIRYTPKLAGLEGLDNQEKREIVPKKPRGSLYQNPKADELVHEIYSRTSPFGLIWFQS